MQLKGITSLLRKERKYVGDIFCQVVTTTHLQSRELRKNSVPSVFDFPDHLRNQVNERVPSIRLYVDEIQTDPEDYVLPPGSCRGCKTANPSSPTKEELKEKLENIVLSAAANS